MVIKYEILHVTILTCQTRYAYWYSRGISAMRKLSSFWLDWGLLHRWEFHAWSVAWSIANGGEGHKPRVELSTVVLLNDAVI